MRQFYKILFIALPIFALFSCVTQRKKDEAKGLKLFFHNLSSKYNGFFNATVLMNDAVEKLNFQHQDNYNQILDVYPEIAVDNATAVAPDLDKAMEKVAVVATFHRPSHWTDDSYLLLGKAQHYKHDFQAAQESFEYLVDVYDPSLKKKMSSKERKKAADEARKEKAQERSDAAKVKQQEREEQAKEKKKALEDAKKEKEERAKKEQEELEKRNLEKKKEVENAAKERKTKAEGEKKTVTDRNEARRKANEDRRIANEEARKQAAKDAKNKKTQPTVEKEEKVAVVKDKTEKEDKKVIKKTGSNSTPLFVTEDDNKKAKSKGKPKSYFLKHRPCHQEGMVWLARTYTERQNYSDAELLLDNLEKSSKTFKDIRRQAAVAKVNLFLKEKNYEQAVPALEYALKISKKKKIKARLSYILAQIYQMTNNNDKAFAAFDKVLDYGPAYEMEFNARLNMALTSSTSSENTIALLLKMAKNFKNREYGDQIYFTLAQIALKGDNKPLAVEYLQQSLATVGRNKQQKIESYYLMAKLQYESENYVQAKAYYDSTITVMSKDDNRKTEVERYATNLIEIARNIEIITLQDSLLKLAAMTDKERKAVATQIKRAQVERDKAKAVPSVSGGGGLDLSLQGGTSKSNYWAYNADLVKKGKKEFDKKWGADRKLEDNWRRINKKGSNGDFAQNPEINSGELTDREAKEILKDVPKTQADIDAAKTKVDEALFQLGTLYHDKLQNDKKTAETLEKHLDRFPANKHEMEDFYYLYLAHTELKNTPKAKDYYNRLQEKYPTSTYALSLKDPNALKNKEEQSVDRFYDDTYTYFKSGDYKKTSERIAVSQTTFGVNNPLKAKFALLNAMCMGSLQGREAYLNALKEVIAKFAETPEEKNAKEMLRILENGITIAQPVADDPKNKSSNDGFKVENDKLHYVLIVLPKDAIVEDAKIAVSDFNTKYYRTDDLKLTSIFVNTEPEIPAIIIRRYKDKATAVAYTEGVAKNAGDFIKGVKYEVYAATQDNYREILRQKTLDAYKLFYDKNYKK